MQRRGATVPARSRASGLGAEPGSRQGSGVPARRLALDALRRIDEGAYANLTMPAVLARGGLAERDRALVTELVYGTTRMRRACDHAVDPFLRREVDQPTRAALRLGAYQLLFLGTPAHAAVSTTVDAVDGPAAGLVNAVLRRVAEAGQPVWPSDAVRLSYPDWIVERVVADLGRADAMAALETMNRPAEVHTRSDGYVQDPASTVVAEAVAAHDGETVLDLCAAPGGKATWIARTGAVVVAADLQAHRAALIQANARTTGTAALVSAVVSDGTVAAFAPRSFDRVLVDAPCSGLGVLRRRPDARWRIQPADVDDLVGLQRRLIASGLELLRPGGTFVYSVCTFTRAETAAHDRWLAAVHPELAPVAPPAGWRTAGRGGLCLPHDAGADGMFVLTLRQRWE